MVVISVMYPASSRFDETYYLQKHMPMARAKAGASLVDARVLRGYPGPDGSAPQYQIIAELTFNSLTDVQTAMSGSEGEDVMADVKNFTDATPVVLVSEVIG